MTRTSILTLALPLLLSLTACGDELPTNPTWTSHVEEIILGNCVRCHGPVQRAENPDDFPVDLRLDLYESDDPLIRTISTTGVVDSIIRKAVNYESEGVRQMPPDSYLTEDQKEILRLWAEQDHQF